MASIHRAILFIRQFFIHIGLHKFLQVLNFLSVDFKLSWVFFNCGLGVFMEFLILICLQLFILLFNSTEACDLWLWCLFLSIFLTFHWSLDRSSWLLSCFFGPAFRGFTHIWSTRVVGRDRLSRVRSLCFRDLKATGLRRWSSRLTLAILMFASARFWRSRRITSSLFFFWNFANGNLINFHFFWKWLLLIFSVPIWIFVCRFHFKFLWLFGLIWIRWFFNNDLFINSCLWL